MALSQQQQLDEILTAYGPIVGMVLILLGLSLTLAGPRLIPLLTAWALFVPFSFTAGAVANAYLGVDPKIAIWIGIAVGMLAGYSGQSLGKYFHIIVGGAAGMGVMAVILSILIEFYDFNWIVAAVVLDLAFIIGARFAKDAKEAVTFVSSSSLGGISIAAGVAITSAGMNGLDDFSPATGQSAMIIVACILVGSFFQQWRYGDDFE